MKFNFLGSLVGSAVLAAVLVVTSDYEEAVQVADRSYVMSRGRVVTELVGDAITTGQLLAAAGG